MNISLRWKLILGSALIEVVMLGLLVFNSTRLIETKLETQAEVRLRELSVLLNAAVAPAMAQIDYGTIQGVFAQSRRQDGIVYFALFDKNGKRVAVDGWPADRPLPPLQRQIGHDGTRFDTDIPITIGRQAYGRLQFGISTEFLALAKAELVRQSIAIAALEVLLSVLLLALLGLWLTRHLARLEAASLDVARGRFDVEVEVAGRDEIGRVGDAFNRMTHELQRRLTELSDSENRFRGLTELSADWYWEQDRELRFIDFHGGAAGATAALRGELLGQRLWEKTGIKAHDAAWSAYRRQLASRLEFRDFEYEYADGRGGSIFISTSGTPHFDNAGVFSGYRGVDKDITERKRFERALIRGEHLLRVSQEAARIGHYVIELADGRWESSPLLDRMFGIAADYPHDLDGWRRLLNPDDRQRIVDDFDHTIKEGKPFSREYRIVRPADGTTRWVCAWGDYERDVDGNPVRQIGAVQDITDRKAAAEEIENLAYYDPLTQLPNRRLLQDRLQHTLSNRSRRKHQAAVVLLDLDDFKTLNDTLGHDVGDRLLVEVARRIASCLREGDTVGRLGGDEFVVILDDLDEDTTQAAIQAETVAAKILACLAQTYTLRIASLGDDDEYRDYHCTSSIGVALFADDTLSVDELMKRADTAMYQAKAAGRNAMRFFDPDMQAAISARATLDNDLRSAIMAKQFLLHYQPQVDARGRVIGAEALIRWRHPERGMVSPDDFVPHAEGAGLILPIGSWVLATACAQLAIWAKHPATAHLSLAINVSARQFRHANFVGQILDEIALTGANPNRLKLELTESLLIENVEAIRERMVALKAHGIRFSLDDFGTGYSSLSYLKRLPLDQLKIDHSFVRDVLADPNDAAIAQTIVALAKSLGLHVIAEGVEIKAQHDLLTRLGCGDYQGYYFSRPVPLDEFERLVMASNQATEKASPNAT